MDCCSTAPRLQPDYPEAANNLGLALHAMGRFAEARAAIQRAWEVDPLSLTTITTAGLVSYFERDYDAAIPQYLKALELDSNFAIAHYFLGQAYLEKNMFDEAVAELERAVSLSNRSSECVAVLGYAHAIAGNASKAAELARELESRSADRYLSPVLLACIHLGLGV